VVHRPRQLSLISGALPIVLLAVGAAAAAWLLVRRDRRHLVRTVPVLVLTALATSGALAFVVERIWRPFPDALPPSIDFWVGVGVGGLLLAVPRLRHGRGVCSRTLTVLAAVSVLLTASSQVNLFFRAFPTVATALRHAAGRQVYFATVPGPAATLITGAPVERVWVAPSSMPATGEVSKVAIPGAVSGFAAREAEVYLPPAYLSTPRARLPVLVLLAGQPGSPTDWVTINGLAPMMDAYAARHGGLAPVVIMPDATGSILGNPLCLDSALGNVATYLSVDVPNWVRSHLQVSTDAVQWAIGGLSYGGTCSLQMAVNHATVYPTFLDISGQVEPTLGDRTKTVSAAFGGDASRFVAVNPVDVMARNSLTDSHGVFVVGAQDDEYRPQAQKLFKVARAAGMHVQYQEVPGGHDFGVWRKGLVDNLDWLGTRLGLTA